MFYTFNLTITRFARRREGFTLIHYVVYVFHTDMNYAKWYDKCVVLFCRRKLLEKGKIFFCNYMYMQYVLKFAAPISKCFRRPCNMPPPWLGTWWTPGSVSCSRVSPSGARLRSCCPNRTPHPCHCLQAEIKFLLIITIF